MIIFYVKQTRKRDMSNKIKILLGLILIEILAIVFSLSMENKQTSLNNNNLQQFALLDSAGISGFVFGNTTLQRNEYGAWRVNNKYPIDAPLLRQLFQLLAKVEIKKPISDDAKKELTEQIKTEGIEVKYLKDGASIQSFKMIEKNGECHILTNDNQAFVLYVPGYIILLSEVFKMSEGDWREKTVISSRFLGLSKIKVTYTNKPEESFEIEKDSLFFKVQGISQLDTNMVGNYVDAYKSVRVFSFLDKPTIKDSLSKATPYCLIEVDDIDKDKSNSIKVFTNRERIYGILGKTEELVVRTALFYPLFGKEEGLC